MVVGVELMVFLYIRKNRVFAYMLFKAIREESRFLNLELCYQNLVKKYDFYVKLMV